MLVMIGWNDRFQIRLAELVAAAGAASAEFDARLAHGRHQTVGKIEIRVALHQIEGVVARAFHLEIDPEPFCIDAPKEAMKIFRSLPDVGVEALELSATEDSSELR